MNDLSELMQRDPNHCSDQDIDEIIKYIRAQRPGLVEKKKAGEIDLNKSLKKEKLTDLSDLEL